LILGKFWNCFYGFPGKIVAHNTEAMRDVNGSDNHPQFNHFKEISTQLKQNHDVCYLTNFSTEM
jgi:hypothetical protein